MVCIETQQFPKSSIAVGGVLPLLCDDWDKLRFAGEGLGRFDMFTRAYGASGRGVAFASEVLVRFDVFEAADNRTESRTHEGQSKLELFGLGCQFSQHWPRGDEIVVGERFVCPSLVAGDLMEEVGELAGSIAYVA